VIAEAMHCGRPVIATDVGCVGEVIEHRISGIVVQPDPQDIAAAAKQIHQYPHWARGLAAEGQAVAERRFHARQMSEQYGRVLQQVHAARLATAQNGVT
jgi:glycosyltransferase involved in cell wall biosynthesis